MLKRLLKQFLCGFLFYSGVFSLTRFLSDRYRRRAFILCYHRVVIGPPDKYSTPGTQLEIANFRSQLKFLTKHYEIISLSQLVSELAKGEELPHGGYAVLTFDDGFVDGYTNVFPILKELSVSATFFVSPWAISSSCPHWHDKLWYYLNSINGLATHLHFRDFFLPVVSQNDKLNARSKIMRYLSSQSPWQREELLSEIKTSLGLANLEMPSPPLMITPESILEMEASGLIEWGAHSLSHPMLSLCTRDQMEIEVKESKKGLESMLGASVDYFAYPFGNHTQETVEAVRRHGYKAAVTTEDGLIGAGDDLFLLKRLNVFRDDTSTSLATLKIMACYLKRLFEFNPR